MKNISRIIFTASFVLLMSVSVAMAYTEEELALQRIEDRMSTMEKGMATMQKELYRNSGKKRSSQPDESIGANDEIARDINGKVEELQHNIDVLASKLDKIIADIDFRIAALESKTVAIAETKKNEVKSEPLDISPPKKSDKDTVDGFELGKPALLNPGEAIKNEYESAYELIRLSKYDEAEQAFKNFINNNKESTLLDNAYFWLAESYYARKNYQLAAVNFLKGYQEFPKGNKAAESLFKLGLSLKGMEKETEACATFAKVKKEYPAADKLLIAKIDSENKELKCK